MGRKRRTSVDALVDAPQINYGTQPVELMYPTLHKVATSNEMRLFDLASIQLELERVLTNTMERLQCLSAEAKGKRIPTTILHSLQLRSATANTPVNSGRPSLVVKANPNKPLTLIISQQNHPVQSHPPVPPVAEPPGSTRTKCFPSPVCLRKVNRYSQREQVEQISPASPDKNQNPSGYAIPNKFWELMEPYCAELTEANISFLEGLIRSYQDMEATYFQLPSLRSPDVPKVESFESPAHKRPRHEAVHASSYHSATNAVVNADGPNSIFATTSGIQRAQLLEAELRNPIPESSALFKLSSSLLSSCYQENILLGFAEGFKRLSDESDKHFGANATGSTDHDQDAPSVPSSPNVSKHIFDNCPESTALGTTSPDGTTNPLITLPDEIRHWVTMKASQPLKVLAKQMRVSSSYRVEKKISQAMAELGIIPLKVMHPTESSVSNSFHPPMKLEDQCSSKSTADTVTPEDKITVKSPDLLSSPRHPAPAINVNVGCKIRSCISKTPVHSPLKSDPSTTGDTELNRSPVGDIQARCVAESSPPSGAFKANSQPCSFRVRKPHRSTRKRRLRITLHSAAVTVTQNGYPCGTRPTEDYGSNYDSSECNGALSSDDGLDINDKVCTGSPTVCEHSSTGKRTVLSACGRHTGMDEDDCCSNCSIHNALRPGQSEVNGTRTMKMDETPPTLVNGDMLDSSHQLPSGCVASRRFAVTPLDFHGSDIHSGVVVNHSLENSGGQEASIHAPKPCSNDFLRSGEAQPGTFASSSDPVGGSKSDDTLCPLEVDHNQHILHTGSAVAFPSAPDTVLTREMPDDELGRAILQRQRELRVVCAENHSVLRRLIQAARRDMQRQEIQRRLAIADADVIEAYNRLESYRPQRKPPLKRDRDSAYKALRERCKILKELEAFDAKSP